MESSATFNKGYVANVRTLRADDGQAYRSEAALRTLRGVVGEEGGVGRSHSLDCRENPWTADPLACPECAVLAEQKAERDALAEEADGLAEAED